MPSQRLKSYLDENRVKYVSIRHSEAFTAMEIAASAHVPGRELAKSVMIKIDGKIAMMVLPSSEHLDFEKLRDVIGAKSVALAAEKDFAHLFPGCEIGAMPPFGNLWSVPVYVTETLTRDESIAFNAGTHTELLQLAYADFHRLVRPHVLSLA